MVYGLISLLEEHLSAARAELETLFTHDNLVEYF